jgi:threonine aldolase
MKPIDLRSDTVTKPTPEMRKAMAEAEVGDDQYLEDPTVKVLQDRAAEKMGMEAALFMPSGTMGNQVAIKIHTQPGQEVITEERGHIYNYEMAAMSAIGGVLPRAIFGEGGVLEVDAIKKSIRPKVYSRPQTGLITLENTHNHAGGGVYPISKAQEVISFAKEAGIPVHLDGARIFNAATALGCEAKELTQGFDSVMFCLSKGLCAPVGSVLCGSREFVRRALSVRKLLGGALRQVGVLAAAGLVGLEKMVERLGEDHDHARVLAEQLAEIEGISIEPKGVQTNILFFELTRDGITAPDLSNALKERGVLANAVDEHRIRMLTHNDVSREDCLLAADIVRDVMQRQATGSSSHEET